MLKSYVVPDAMQSTEWIRLDDFRPTLQAWLDFWLDRLVTVDIDRVLRYAILANRPRVVEYLLGNTRASVMSRDILDRTALFYAVSMRTTTTVLDLTINSMGERSTMYSELERQDLYGNTVAYYAAISPAVQNLESLLLACYDADLRTRIAQDTFSRLQGKGLSSTDCVFILLLYGTLQRWLNFPVYVQHDADKMTGGSYRGVFTVGDLHAQFAHLNTFLESGRYSDQVPNSLIWIHMPWTNVRVILSCETTC